MTTPGTTWWEDPTTDWTQGLPARAVDLLVAAYEEPSEIKYIAQTVGLSWDGGVGRATAREAWRWTLTQAAGRNLALDLAAEVLRDEASAAFHAPLRQLLGDRLGAAEARGALRYGLPPATSSRPDRVLESLVDAATTVGDDPVGGLEAITSVSAAFDDPHAYVQGIVDATRRTAMIQVGGHPRGTGFLVGPDLLLTAAHVIDGRQWPPSPLPEAEAVFDYFPQPGRSQAETGVRVPVTEFMTASLPTAAEVAGQVADWNAPRDRLDFALLRLGWCPPVEQTGAGGRERGAYVLDRTEYDFAHSPLLLIIQHPLGDFQRFTFIKAPPQPNPLRTRIRYRGNTLQGASGSPVIDSRGRLVALHHYSQGGNNQGVPFDTIAAALLDGPLGPRLVPGPAVRLVAPEVDPTTAGGSLAAARSPGADADPFLTTSLRGRPFVDRVNLRDGLRSVALSDGPNRTIAITGESGSGVSYSYELASHVAARSRLSAPLRQVAPGGLVAVRIDLRDYLSAGVEERRMLIAGDLLVALKLREPTPQPAQEARNTSTLRLWLSTVLRGGDRQWWIFIDSIDNLVAVKQGGVDELIHALILVADDPQVMLRVVLAGQRAAQFAQEHLSWVAEDTAVGLVRSDVETWLRARAAEEGRTCDEQRLAAEVDLLFPLGGPLPEPRRLAPLLPRVLARLIEVPDGR
jgi:hypothetical protein